MKLWRAKHFPPWPFADRYHERAVPVLSYVSQLAGPPAHADVARLNGQSVHKILRLPATSVSRVLCHSVSFCSAVDPIPLNSYCAANLYRFAHSARDYLLDLGVGIRKSTEDDRALRDCNPTWWEHVDLPRSGFGDSLVLQVFWIPSIAEGISPGSKALTAPQPAACTQQPATASATK